MDEDVIIIRKDVLIKVVIFNNKESDWEVIVFFDGWLSMLKNEIVSFKIIKFVMSDIGIYFCYLEIEDWIDGILGCDEVKIKVVGECGLCFYLYNWVVRFN